MNIAIYARKSKISNKGESIKNQINMCKTYILSNYSDIGTIYIYSDTGYSGGNDNRPMFQKMILDSRYELFNMLVCYRLDRISRNISHFSNTYDVLRANKIEFISIKEQFDTSNPIGRAMLNIAMVFAQLERETIAERVRDNMYLLASTGQWLGGIAPTGFKSISCTKDGKKTYMLSEIKEEIYIVNEIFNSFLELKSLRKVVRYLHNHDIKTKNNCYFSAATIRDILINPVYAKADRNIYLYFKGLKANLYGDISLYKGVNGILVYNKTNQEMGIIKQNPVSSWIVAIGEHKGIIDGDKWILVQKILYLNNTKKRCSNCFSNS